MIKLLLSKRLLRLPLHIACLLKLHSLLKLLSFYLWRWTYLNLSTIGKMVELTSRKKNLCKI